MRNDIEKKVTEAYDRVSLPDEARGRILDNVLSRAEFAAADNIEPIDHSRRPLRSRWRLAGSIAAIVALIAAFGGIAYANGWFGLGFREYAPEPETTSYVVTTVNQEGETVAVAEITQEHRYLSLVGAIGSPEQLGQSEWKRWKSEYIRNAPANGVELPCTEVPFDNIDKVYSAFNDEMKDKLADICEKYSLKLHPDERDADNYEELCRVLGYAPLRELQTDDQFWAVYYTDGAFHLNEMDRQTGLYLSLFYNLTGVLDEVSGGLFSDPSEYEERIVTTAEGVQILVAENKDDEKGETFLVIPLDKGQITIRVFFETRYEDTTVRESSKDRYKTVSRGLTEDELQDLIAMIDIGSMGRQTQDVLEDNIKYAENYTSIIQETVPDARNDVQKLDTTLQEATPEIKELVEKYYRGEQDGDPDMIRQTSMYPEVVVDKCVLRDAEYYENIRVDDIYMVPAANDGEWMLFVRYEIKYKDMDPVLTYISTFYVFTDEDGSLKQIILSSPMRMYFEQDQYVRGILGTLMAANEAYPEVVEMREECSEAFEKARDDDPEFDEFMTFWKTRTSFLDELWGTRD